MNEHKKPLDKLLEAKLRQLEGKFKRKYGDPKRNEGNEAAIRRHMMKKQLSKDEIQGHPYTREYAEEFSQDPGPASTMMQHLRETDSESCFSRMQFEELGKDFDHLKLKDGAHFDRRKIEDCLKEEHLQEIKRQNMESNNLYLKEKRGDGFLNR